MLPIYKSVSKYCHTPLWIVFLEWFSVLASIENNVLFFVKDQKVWVKKDTEEKMGSFLLSSSFYNINGKTL